MANIVIRETKARSVLTKSKLPETDYVINPYTGCLHACKYCYAEFMKRFTDHLEPWGKFIDIKINALEVLKSEISRLKSNDQVLLSSVTDPYNPAEKKYKLTRQILAILPKNIQLSILTKSDLVLRDIDLLKTFPNCEVGFSIFSLKEADIKNFEANTVSPARRLKALAELKKQGIKTYAFIAPILPDLTNLEAIFAKIAKAKVDFAYCESFNYQSTPKQIVVEIIKTKYPQLSISQFNHFNPLLWQDIKQQIIKLSADYNIPTKIFIHSPTNSLY